MDEGLEDTIPASDPVFATHTTRSGTASTYTQGNIKFAVENKIRDRTLAAAAIAAGLGFIFGLTRNEKGGLAAALLLHIARRSGAKCPHQSLAAFGPQAALIGVGLRD